MNIEYIDSEPCAHCHRPESDHDTESNADNNCSGYESAEEKHTREADESALALYDALQEEVTDQ